jgi:hypothetical protein
MDCQHDGGKIPTLGAAVPYYGGQPTAAAELIKNSYPSTICQTLVSMMAGPLMKLILKKNKVAHVAYFMKDEPWFSTILHRATMKKQLTLSWTRTIDFKRTEEVKCNACYKSGTIGSPLLYTVNVKYFKKLNEIVEFELYLKQIKNDGEVRRSSL